MVSRNDVLCGEELPMETNGTCQRRICLMAALFSSSLFSSPFFSLFLKHLHSRRNFAISREVDKIDGIKKGSSSLKTIRFIRNLGEKKDRGIGLLTISSIGHSYWVRGGHDRNRVEGRLARNALGMRALPVEGARTGVMYVRRWKGNCLMDGSNIIHALYYGQLQRDVVLINYFRWQQL